MDGVEVAERLENLDRQENDRRARYSRERAQTARNFDVHLDMGRHDHEVRRLETVFQEDLDYIRHQRDRLQLAGRHQNFEIRRDGRAVRRPNSRWHSPFFDEDTEARRHETVVRSELTLDQLDRLRGLTIEPGAMIAVDDPHEVIARHAEADRQRAVAQAFEQAMLHGRGAWKVAVDEDAEYKENDVKTTEKQASFAYCAEGHKKYIEPQERAFYLARCTEQGCKNFLKAGTALEATTQDGPAKSKKQAVNP